MPDRFDVLLSLGSDALNREYDVSDHLTSAAERYLGAIGVIATLHTVLPPDFSRLSGAYRISVSVIFALGALLLVLGAFLSIRDFRLRKYPAYPKTPELETIISTSAADQQVTKGVADTLLRMRDAVRAINDSRAKRLRIVGDLVLIGFLLTLVARCALLK